MTHILSRARPQISPTAPVFALLIAALFANLWFSSAPMPLGGPNGIIAAAAVLLALLSVAIRLLRPAQERPAGLAALYHDNRKHWQNTGKTLADALPKSGRVQCLEQFGDC